MIYLFTGSMCDVADKLLCSHAKRAFSLSPIAFRFCDIAIWSRHHKEIVKIIVSHSYIWCAVFCTCGLLRCK